MKTIIRPHLLAPLLFAAASYAQQEGKDAKDVPIQQQAQAPAPDEWQFFFSPYAWLPSIDLNLSTPIATVGGHTLGGDFSVQQPCWDTLGKLGSDFFVISLDGRLEAWKGRWGGFIDGYCIFGKSTVDGSDSRLIFRDRVDIATSSSVTSRFDTGQVNFGPEYKLGTASLGTESSVSFVAYGGGRVNWIGNDLDGQLRITASADGGEIGQTFKFSSDRSRVVAETETGTSKRPSLGNRGAILPSTSAIARAGRTSGRTAMAMSAAGSRGRSSG